MLFYIGPDVGRKEIPSLASNFAAAIGKSQAGSILQAKRCARHYVAGRACYKTLGCIMQFIDVYIRLHTLDTGSLQRPMNMHFCQSPEISLTGCNQLAVNQVIMVGDTVSDLKMAKAAGAMAVAITGGAGGRSELEQQADIMIDSLEEICVI